MKFFDFGMIEVFGFQIVIMSYLLLVSKPTEARTRISTFYRRFIRNTGDNDEEQNFIEKIHNSSAPVYNHYILKTTELYISPDNPSCAKLCPKGNVVSSANLYILQCSK